MSSRYILAIETSSSICGVAVIHNNEVLSIAALEPNDWEKILMAIGPDRNIETH